MKVLLYGTQHLFKMHIPYYEFFLVLRLNLYLTKTQGHENKILQKTVHHILTRHACIPNYNFVTMTYEG